jgi:hypothetical protein
VSDYNDSGSGSSGPDLWLDLYNGTDWINISSFGFTASGQNKSIVSSDSSVLQGWLTPANRNIRIRGINFDYANSTYMDQINWTEVWVDVAGGVEFVNDTWAEMTGTGNWSNVTKTVNSTQGATIRWRVYTNDTAGKWNATPIFTYQTSSPTNFPPDINLEYPSNNTINTTDTTPDFIFNATDASASTLSCELFLDNGTIFGAGINTSTLNGTTTTITSNMTLINDDYNWWINCSDGSLSNVSETRNLSIVLDVAPVITTTSPLNTSYNSLPINLNVTLNEDGDWCGYNLDDGSNTTLLNDSLTNWFIEMNPSSGLHQLNVYCNDTAGNMGENTTIWFTYDPNPPDTFIEYPSNNTLNTTTRRPDFAFNATDELVSTLSCELFFDNGTVFSGGTNTSVLNDTSTTMTTSPALLDDDYNWWINCSDGVNTNQSEVRNISIQFALSANYSNFTGQQTTQFNNEPDITNVISATLHMAGIARIRWYNAVNASWADFDSYVDLGQFFVYVNSSGLNNTFNSTANITFYNLPWTELPIIYEDGSQCSDCVVNFFSGGVLSFNVTHFSNYSAGVNE